MIRKIPTIKPANAPTMNHYRSVAKASHGAKLKSMGIGGYGKSSRGNVTTGPAADREMAGMEAEAQHGSTSGMARGGLFRASASPAAKRPNGKWRR
jgi:hypothetical protein